MFWNWKKKPRRSRSDLKAVVAKAKDGAIDIEADEVTDVIDLATSSVRKEYEECQRMTDTAIEELETVRLPEPGRAESI